MGARPASPQSLGSKAALTVPPGVKDSVASSVKCQELTYPEEVSWGTDLGSLGSLWVLREPSWHPLP